MTKEQIVKEINDIENAMAGDDSMSPFSFSYVQAEERLEELKKMLKEYEKKVTK